MIMITKLIMIGIAIVCLVTLAFVLQDFVADKVRGKSSKINKVHFYVARDTDGLLWLYIGKPYRGRTKFFYDMKKGSCAICCHDFEFLGLNQDDFKDLKWKDEPVEVFVNMED